MKDTFILIKSCWSNPERRAAIRETWLTQLDHSRADYSFVLGSHKPDRPYGDPCSNRWNEADLKIYHEPDGFRHIGPKLRRCFQDLVGKYEKVVVLDDDTFVIPERLRQIVSTVQSNDCFGFMRQDAGSWGPIVYPQGSAYILGSEALKICSTAEILCRVMPDDVAVGAALAPPALINFHHECRFDPGPSPYSEDMIGLATTHKVNPAQMRKLHALQHFDQSI